MSFCETLTVLPRSVSSLATRCCASSRRRDSLPSCLRTCTSWSRRPFPFASILSATARTAMPSSGSFWSSPVFIDWRVTTKPSEFSRPPGSTRVAQPLPSCHKWRDEQGRKKRTTRQQNDVPCLPLELTENTHFPVDLQTQTCSFLYLLSSWKCIHTHTHCLFCSLPCFIWLKVAGAREDSSRYHLLPYMHAHTLFVYAFEDWNKSFVLVSSSFLSFLKVFLNPMGLEGVCRKGSKQGNLFFSAIAKSSGRL